MQRALNDMIAKYNGRAVRLPSLDDLPVRAVATFDAAPAARAFWITTIADGMSAATIEECREQAEQAVDAILAVSTLPPVPTEECIRCQNEAPARRMAHGYCPSCRNDGGAVVMEIQEARERLSGLNGLHFGLLTPSEQEALRALIAEGEASVSYEGAAGFLGIGKVRLRLAPEAPERSSTLPPVPHSECDGCGYEAPSHNLTAGLCGACHNLATRW